MTREEAKKILLASTEKNIKKFGENEVALLSPKKGKSYWTYKEYKEAVENDTCLEDSDTNPIDTLLRYEKYRIEHGQCSLVELNNTK